MVSTHVAAFLLAAASSVSAAFTTSPPALVRRPQLAPLSGPVCRAESGATNDPVPKPPSKLPQREIDSRGFIVPQVGDVVKMPSKWKGEWEVGQVDFVQYVGSRNAYEVDLLPLKSIGNDLYRLPGKKPSLIRTDVAKLGRLLTEYVPERDAYRVNPDDLLPTGGRKVENPSVTEQGLAEYAELKATLLREAALLGVAGTAVSMPFFGGDVAFAFALGAAGGCAYLALLQRETDGREGMGRLLAAIVGGRLALPAVVMAVLASRGIAAKGGHFDFALVPRDQFGAAVLGFLAYKAPLLVRQVGTALKELASNEGSQVPIEKSMSGGSLSLMAKLATANFQQQSPERFGFSVSCTTRPRRPAEADGVDYSFVTDPKFDTMIERGDFLEWASVGSYRYGTSVAAVEAVSASGRVCLLDLDVQGVQSLVERRPDLNPYCVWVAAPSLDALRARLRQRGSEAQGDVEQRIARAVDEIEFSLSARCFDKVVLNDDFERAYAELMAGIDEATMSS